MIKTVRLGRMTEWGGSWEDVAVVNVRGPTSWPAVVTEGYH